MVVFWYHQSARWIVLPISEVPSLRLPTSLTIPPFLPFPPSFPPLLLYPPPIPLSSPPALPKSPFLSSARNSFLCSLISPSLLLPFFPYFIKLFSSYSPVPHSPLRPSLPPRLSLPARRRPPFYSNSIPEFHRIFLPLRNRNTLPRGFLHRLRRNPHPHRYLRFHVSTFPRLGPRNPRRRPVFPRFHRPPGAVPRFIRRFLAGIRFQIPRDSCFARFGVVFPRL